MINAKNITKFVVIVTLLALLTTCTKKQEEDVIKESITITSDQYVQLVADFRNDTEWKFKGKKPCVVDFYADWCRHCEKVAPTYEKVAEKYAGKVDFYKVDVDANKDIADAYKLVGIPTFFFCSADGGLVRIFKVLSEEDIIKQVDLMLSK